MAIYKPHKIRKMNQKIIIACLLIFFWKLQASAQKNTLTAETVLEDLKQEILFTDSLQTKVITDVGFNMYVQKKVATYLSGASDLSLASFYGTYSSDADRLNLGFNIPLNNRYTSRLKVILNPMIETNIKNNFAAVYKNGAWQNDIRAGLKATFLLPFSTLNFDVLRDEHDDKYNDLKIVRAKKYNELAKKIREEESVLERGYKLLNDSTIMPTHDKDEKKSAVKKKRKELYQAIGQSEIDYIETQRSNYWLNTYWISGWFMAPMTETEKYISKDNVSSFETKKFKLWDVNLQLNWLSDSKRVGTFFVSMWVKHFQNNSVTADLMNSVDYVQYAQLPGTDPQSFAALETNKGYVGAYDEFTTTAYHAQVVYFLPLFNTLIKPGVSVRYEKNWGDYCPQNFRLGIPLAIQGKGDAVVNIELQYRLNNLNNYRKDEDYSQNHTFGVNIGIPFVALYK